MRMRRKKNGAQRLAACSDLLIKAQEKIGSSSDVFSNDGELHLEIGCGKGGFACGMAEKYPSVNFIALERVHDVMVLALEKAKSRSELRPNDNLRFMLTGAENLSELFDAHSLDTIYLNFSDPWHKNGYSKRRLTYRKFLYTYFDLLKVGGKLRFKTDNRALFDFTLEELAAIGVECDFVTNDLHASEYAADNVMTEYETNFTSQGMKINFLCVTSKGKVEKVEKSEKSEKAEKAEE